MIRQGSIGATCGRRLAVAVVLAALLGAIPLVAGGPQPAHARGDADGDCVTVPRGSQGRAICTYTDVSAIFFADLVDAVGGSGSGSGIWVQAWGGQGGTAPDDNNAGGAGGAGGYAQIYYSSLSSYAASLGDPSALYFYYGGNGSSNSSSGAGAGGGASTLVASADVTEGDSTTAYGPCVVADSHAADQDGNTVAVPNDSGSGKTCNEQSVVVLAGGGGGGGGTCGRCHSGKPGGAGGIAVATTTTVVGRGSDGASPYPNRAGIGGFNGTGGRNHKNPSGNAGDGIGGLGGPYKDSSAASDSGGSFVGSVFFVGAETNGHGGRGYTFASSNGGDGGGGGGGFGGGGGGGQGGSSLSEAAGSGGGGGGSYAYRGNAPPGAGPPTGAPSANQGAVRIVIDGIPEPEAPLAACAIAQHGTDAAEILHGTGGGDEIFGHGGGDSIATGGGQDCVHAGGDDDQVRGGRGPDTIIAAGGRDGLHGGGGRDKIRAEGGHHDVHGGRGADRIRTRDSERDTISCGSGRDEAWVDASDRVARNCEVVHA